MMSPTGSAQSQAVAFHRQAVERLKKEIAGVDRNSSRRYIRDFQEAYGAYQDLSSHDDLIHACSRADLIFFGDYHALPASQSLAAKLLGQIASRSKKVFLAMEMIFGRYQQILDRWLAGEMDEEEFLHRIRYRQEWGYDWNGFRQIFEVARMNGIPVIGIDCEPRNGFRFIRRRDNYAAEKIVDIKIHHPDAKVFVVIGESHLAPSHLPARVKKALGRAAKRTRSVVVLQNLEEIYWQLAETGKEQQEVVSLGEDRFCVFNTSPLEKYESYRQTIEKWREDDEGDYIDLTPTTYRMIDTLLRFLRIDKYTTCVQDGGSSCIEYLVDQYPEVYSWEDAPIFRKMLQRAGISKRESQGILKHVQQHGSYYIPRINAILIGQFNLVHGGEETAHFVNLCLKGEILEHTVPRRRRHDLFYVSVLEEALGFFGSKLFVPSRNHFFETDIYKYYRKNPDAIRKNTPYTPEDLNAIIHFVLLHKKFEVKYQDYDDVPDELIEGVHSRGQRFRILTHELGYYLGQQLYDGFQKGIVRRDEISRLFRQQFIESGSALGTYLDLTEKLKPVRQ